MRQERLKILTMLEDGKISAEEATRLLETLGKSGHTQTSWDEDYYNWDMDERINKFSRNVESFGKEFKCRMGSAYKEMEPKLEKATKTVLEKTAAIIDDISRSINESLKNMDKGSCCDEQEDCCCGCAENVVEVVKDQAEEIKDKVENAVENFSDEHSREN